MMKDLLNACRRFSIRLAAVAIVTLVLGVGVTTAVAGTDFSDCRSLAKAEESKTERLVCNVLFLPTAEQRKAIAEETAKMVQDLRCTLSVDVSRSELAAMMTTSSWKAPAQPVTCDVVTSARSYAATLSLAPKITLIGGKAVSVKLNADDVEGVPPLIGNAMCSYINFNTAFQDELLDIINQHLSDWLKATVRAES